MVISPLSLYCLFFLLVDLRFAWCWRGVSFFLFFRVLPFRFRDWTTDRSGWALALLFFSLFSNLSKRKTPWAAFPFPFFSIPSFSLSFLVKE